MRHSFCLLLIVFAINTGIAQSKSLPAFSSISTSGSVKVELIKGDESKADYTILKGKEEDLLIEVKNNHLTVKIKSKISGMWNRSQTKANITVYYQTLNSIDCSAGSSLTANNEINSRSIGIDASSGASCKVKVNSEDLSVNTSSGSTVTLNGISKTATYDSSSGARIDAGYLISDNADADVSSGASISLHATKSLKADASSGGSIKYRGNPENKNIDSGMSGSIKSF